MEASSPGAAHFLILHSVTFSLLKAKNKKPRIQGLLCFLFCTERESQNNYVFLIFFNVFNVF